jgi:hypothetical protein
LRRDVSVAGAAAKTAAPAVPKLDILEAAAALIRAPRVLSSAGHVSCLSAMDQGNENRCVASALCFAMYLRALLLAPPATRLLLAHADNLPSPCHAYDAQRLLECNDTARCSCGPMCGGVCDNCGSVVTYMVEACEAGIVTEHSFPSAQANSTKLTLESRGDGYRESRCYYRLEPNGAAWLSITAGADKLAARIEHCIGAGQPVVINTIHYASQDAFYRRLDGDREAGVSPYDSKYLMPPKDAGERPSTMGHVMLVVGANPAQRRLRVLNSRGAAWGFHGCCCISYDHLAPTYLKSALAVQRVALHNIEKARR